MQTKGLAWRQTGKSGNFWGLFFVSGIEGYGPGVLERIFLSLGPAIGDNTILGFRGRLLEKQ